MSSLRDRLAEATMAGKARGANYGLEVRYTLRAFQRAFAKVQPVEGVTASEFRLLRTLGEGEGSTQAELAALAGMDRPYVSSLVKKMIRAGWLETAPNADDRRRIDLALSVAGMAVYQRIADELALVNRVAVKGIAARELAAFTDVLARIRANLEHYG